MTPIHKKVRFQGQIYWRNGRQISPLDHFNESGELLADPLSDVSYAVVTDNGDIMRFCEIIGREEDLEDIPA